MLLKIMIEILILWVCYALYMAILVHKRGPIGGIFFYPKGMQERVIELGLITPEDLNDTWHSTKVKRWKMVKLIPFSVPIAAIAGGLCWLIGMLVG